MARSYSNLNHVEEIFLKVSDQQCYSRNALTLQRIDLVASRPWGFLQMSIGHRWTRLATNLMSSARYCFLHILNITLIFIMMMMINDELYHDHLRWSWWVHLDHIISSWWSTSSITFSYRFIRNAYKWCYNFIITSSSMMLCFILMIIYSNPS